MIVAIAGMYRSGSTFSFNIAREILGNTGDVIAVSDNSLPPGFAGNAGHLVMKTHAPDSQLTALIAGQAISCICTYRKPEDAVASWVRTFGGTPEAGVAIVESWLAWHVQVSDRVLNISYEQIESDPLGVIGRIQRYLTGGEDRMQA